MQKKACRVNCVATAAAAKEKECRVALKESKSFKDCVNREEQCVCSSARLTAHDHLQGREII